MWIATFQSRVKRLTQLSFQTTMTNTFHNKEAIFIRRKKLELNRDDDMINHRSSITFCHHATKAEMKNLARHAIFPPQRLRDEPKRVSVSKAIHFAAETSVIETKGSELKRRTGCSHVRTKVLHFV